MSTVFQKIEFPRVFWLPRSIFQNVNHIPGISRGIGHPHQGKTCKYKCIPCRSRTISSFCDLCLHTKEIKILKHILRKHLCEVISCFHQFPDSWEGKTDPSTFLGKERKSHTSPSFFISNAFPGCTRSKTQFGSTPEATQMYANIKYCNIGTYVLPIISCLWLPLVGSLLLHCCLILRAEHTEPEIHAVCRLISDWLHKTNYTHIYRMLLREETMDNELLLTRWLCWFAWRLCHNWMD